MSTLKSKLKHYFLGEIVNMIKEVFDFLLEYGFVSEISKSNLEENVSYTKGQFAISVTYDIRCEMMDVGIINNDLECPYNYRALLDCNFGKEEYSLKAQERINKIYESIRQERKWSERKRGLIEILKINKDFLVSNFNL